MVLVISLLRSGLQLFFFSVSRRWLAGFVVDLVGRVGRLGFGKTAFIFLLRTVPLLGICLEFFRNQTDNPKTNNKSKVKKQTNRMALHLLLILIRSILTDPFMGLIIGGWAKKKKNIFCFSLLLLSFSPALEGLISHGFVPTLAAVHRLWELGHFPQGRWHPLPWVPLWRVRYCFFFFWSFVSNPFCNSQVFLISSNVQKSKLLVIIFVLLLWTIVLYWCFMPCPWFELQKTFKLIVHNCLENLLGKSLSSLCD